MESMSGISLEGDVVVITGAGGGLGRAHALEVARRGASVVVNDVGGPGEGEPSPADSVVAEVRAAGGEAVASTDSVATPDGGHAIIRTAIEHFGTVDAVVHNAGVWRHVPFAEMTPENLDPVLDVHLRGAFFVIQPAWSAMVAQGHGRIVLTSSGAGAFGREEGANYAAAKAGLLGLCRALAVEGEQHGIRHVGEHQDVRCRSGAFQTGSAAEFRDAGDGLTDGGVPGEPGLRTERTGVLGRRRTLRPRVHRAGLWMVAE
jgi:NAD(P)-dependent dehydrogenase (short-subunit alcohol dehydrogenase family)